MPNSQSVQAGGKEIEIQRVTGFNGEVNPLLLKKVVPSEELAMLGAFLRARHTQIAFTTGVYDLIHVGHVRYLELAATLGDVLVVGLNSDSSVKQLKGPDRPILSEDKRAEMLCYLASVAFVTIFPETDGANTIRVLRPDAYLCVEGSWEGGDIASKSEVVAMADCGGRVYYSPRQSPTVSTSAILDRVKELQRPEIMEEIQRTFANGNGKDRNHT